MDEIIDSSYVINLDRRPERYKVVKKILDENGFPFVKRFSAIDASKIPKQYIDSIITNDVKRYLDKDIKIRTEHSQVTKGAIGCYLSHINLWNKLVNSDKEYMLIFEDDADIVGHLIDVISDIINSIKNNNIDIFLLHAICPDILNREHLCHSKNPDFYIYAKKTILPIFKINYFWSNAAYIISKKAAYKLLDKALPINEQIDHYMSNSIWNLNLKIYTTFPGLAKQNDIFSTDIQIPCLKSCDSNLKLEFIRMINRRINYKLQYLFICIVIFIFIVIFIRIINTQKYFL